MTLPYNALRAFEAVVRLRGFGRAAETLGVTQSAVSQHVRTLEDWTGRKLLVRGPRETLPTPEGQALADAIMEGLGRIEAVCTELKSPADADFTLVVSCPPGFAVNWLFPRLLRFDQAHPDIPVSIATQTGKAETEIWDAAIRYGPGGFSGMEAVRLMGERLFPVCAPSLTAHLASITDLANQTLLVDELAVNVGTPPTWDFWAATHGITLPHARRIRRFGQSNLAVEAARQGLGVALGREPLVIDALIAGDLVRPFPETALSEYAYWLTLPRHAPKSGPIKAFSDWILNEAQRQPDLPAQ